MAQLILPQGLDQFGNAEACVREGAALALLPHEPAPAAVADAARRLLDEPGFTAAARTVAAEIAAMPTAVVRRGRAGSGADADDLGRPEPDQGWCATRSAGAREAEEPTRVTVPRA